jgi:hypothetical protein
LSLGDFDSEKRSSDEETWNKHDHKTKGAKQSKDKGLAMGSQPSGSKQQPLVACDTLFTGQDGALATGGGLEPAGKEVLMVIDEYGSNLDLDREMIPSIRLLQGKMAGMTHPGDTVGEVSVEEGEFSILSTDTVS